MGRGVDARDRVREEGRRKEEVRGGEHSEVSEGARWAGDRDTAEWSLERRGPSVEGQAALLAG